MPTSGFSVELIYYPDELSYTGNLQSSFYQSCTRDLTAKTLSKHTFDNYPPLDIDYDRTATTVPPFYTIPQILLMILAQLVLVSIYYFPFNCLSYFLILLGMLWYFEDLGSILILINSALILLFIPNMYIAWIMIFAVNCLYIKVMRGKHFRFTLSDARYRKFKLLLSGHDVMVEHGDDLTGAIDSLTLAESRHVHLGGIFGDFEGNFDDHLQSLEKTVKNEDVNSLIDKFVRDNKPKNKKIKCADSPYTEL